MLLTAALQLSLNNCVYAEVCVSLNSNEAQILRKQGNEWRAVETLAEVRSQYFVPITQSTDTQFLTSCLISF